MEGVKMGIETPSRTQKCLLGGRQMKDPLNHNNIIIIKSVL